MAVLAFAAAVALSACLSDAARTSDVSGLEETEITSYRDLCASTIVAETCRMLDPVNKAAVDVNKIMDAMSSNRKAVINLWQELKLNSTHLPCAEFCRTLVGFLHQRGFVVPPTSDVGCYQEDAGRTKCDLDLSPQTLAQAEPSGGDLPDFHQGEVKRQPQTPAEKEEEEEEEAEEQEEGLDYSVDQLTLRVANLFRIYPELSVAVQEMDGVSALLEGNGTNGWRWWWSRSEKAVEKLRKMSVRAEAYVSTAVTKMQKGERDDLVKQWFGDVDTEGRRRIKMVLNSVSLMIANVEYVYPAPNCDKSTYAYVYPRAGKCDQNRLKKRACTMTTKGKLVFYICKLTLDATDAVQIEVLTHEGSHHAVAYTDDVEFEGSTAYGRWTCKKLAKAEPGKALLNADNYCYFIQDLTDSKKR